MDVTPNGSPASSSRGRGRGSGGGRGRGSERGRGRGGGKMSRKQMAKVADMRRIRELPTNESRYEMSEIESLEGGKQTRVDLDGLIQSKTRKYVPKSKLQDIVGADADIEEDMYVFELDLGRISASLGKIPTVEFLGLQNYVLGSDADESDDFDGLVVDGSDEEDYDADAPEQVPSRASNAPSTREIPAVHNLSKPVTKEKHSGSVDFVLDSLLKSTESTSSTNPAQFKATHEITKPSDNEPTSGASIFDGVKEDVDSFLDDL